MKEGLLFLLLLGSLLIGIPEIRGQTVFWGTVRNEGKEPIGNVYVTLSLRGADVILQYAVTDEKGNYSLRYKGNADTVCLSVARLDFEKQSIYVPRRSQRLDFNLKTAVHQLPEITVNPQKSWWKRDTINFSVSAFTSKNDRTIADVLRKMPGIEVSQSGRISYNGEPIGKFYVEDVDLMGGQYGVVSNNLNNKYVATVQVYENHQPIKVLQNNSISNSSAINLVLKEDAKAKWLLSVKLGLGVSPLLWDGEAHAMRFAKKTQGIYSFKANNVGRDASVDLITHYGKYSGGANKDNVLSIPVSAPALPQKRYVFNNAKLLTLNQLWKLNDDYQLRLNASYINDKQERTAASNITYFDNEEKIEINEKIRTATNINKVETNLTLTGNHPAYYLLNELKGGFDGREEKALINTGNQYLKVPYYHLSNDFTWIKSFKHTQLSFQWNNRLNKSPQTLETPPGIYDSIFNSNNPYDKLKQELVRNNVISESSIKLAKVKGHWQQGYTLGYDFKWQKLKSDLGIPEVSTIDSFKNNLSYRQNRLYFLPEWSYIGKDLQLTVSLSSGILFSKSQNRIDRCTDSHKDFFFNPSLYVRYNLGLLWYATVRASYSDNYNDITDLYTGYILTTYRNIIKNRGDFSKTEKQSYTVGLNYRDPIKLTNASVSSSYNVTEQHYLYQQVYEGVLSVRDKVSHNSRPSFLTLSAMYSKGFERFIKKTGIQATYTSGTTEQLQNGMVAKFRRDALLSSFSIEADPAPWTVVSYILNFSEEKSDLKTAIYKTDYGSIMKWKHQLKTFFYPVKRLQLGANMEFENYSGKTSIPNTFFMDIETKYTFNRMEIVLEWNNISNERSYIISNYDDFSSSTSLYKLRPSNVILSLRISL